MSADTPYVRLRHFVPDGDDVGLEDYEVLHPIGEGGFGRVFRARQLAFDRDVAIKVLGATGFADETARRFERECRAVGVLSAHPHIVTIYDSGITPWGRPFIVMEHMAGGSLAHKLASDGPLAVEVALPVMVKICGAVATAHNNGILHRDIKPENLLISGYGEPVLADFGVASIPGGYQTHTGAITASLAHAAPEVLDGLKATAATDIYSMGSTMFTLLAGRPAFESPEHPGLQALIVRTMTQPIPDLRATGIPDEVCAVIERAMAKDPDERFARVEDMAAAIQSAEASLGLVPTLLVVPEDLEVPALDASTNEPDRTVMRERAVLAPELPAPPRRAPRWRSPMATAALVLLLVGGAGTTMVMKSRRPVASVATAPSGVAPEVSPPATTSAQDRLETTSGGERPTAKGGNDDRTPRDAGMVALGGGTVGTAGGAASDGGSTSSAGGYSSTGGTAQSSTGDGGTNESGSTSGTGTKTEAPAPAPADTLLHHLYSDDGSYYFTTSASELNQKTFEYDHAHREAAVWSTGTQKMRRICFGDGRCGGWVYIEKPAGVKTRPLYAFIGPQGDYYTTDKDEIPSQYSGYRVHLFGWAQ